MNDSGMDKNKKVVRTVLIAAFIIAILFWNPFSRSVILFILPLGSGIDDLVFIAALVVAAVFGVFHLNGKRRGG